MNYSETLQYLFARLPMYQRVGSIAYKKDLTNTLMLCNANDNPHEKLRCIHVGGTNGKGSVSHIIASVLQQQGYQVGLYTSPHYKDFRERIKINGTYIPEEFVCEFVAKNLTLFETIKPSFFEMSVVMAFCYFVQQKVDYAVIEVGLGGRLDSTNVIRPLISVITNISYDHMDMLGNTLAQIAYEKAGIIKENTPVIIGESHPESAPVFSQVAHQKKAPLFFADKFYDIISKTQENNSMLITLRSLQAEKSFPSFENIVIESDLLGSYQCLNIRTAYTALQYLMSKPIIPLSIDSIQQGMKHVKENTQFFGRFHVLKSRPTIIFDSAHNEGGLRVLFEEISHMPHHKLHIVYGTLKDKDLSKTFPLLPRNAYYYFCKADIPRGLDSQELQQKAQSYEITGNTYPSVKAAFEAALQQATDNDLVLVTGSIFVVAEVI